MVKWMETYLRQKKVDEVFEAKKMKFVYELHELSKNKTDVGDFVKKILSSITGS